MRNLICAAMAAVVGLGAGGAGGGGSGALLPPANSPRRADPRVSAIVNASVVVNAGAAPRLGHVLMRDGVIESVVLAAEGAKEAPALPDGVGGVGGVGRGGVVDGRGWFMYPGLVEPYLDVEVAAPDRDAAGVHWNRLVTPERRAAEAKGGAGSAAKGLREMGFVAAGIVPRGGIFRGMASVVSLAEVEADASQPRPAVYAEDVYGAVALATARDGGEDNATTVRWESYPGSQMGSIALIRQVFLDADWERSRREAGEAIGPSALATLSRERPVWWDVSDELEALRALKIGAEVGRASVVVGSGLEFRRLSAVVEGVKGAGGGVVVPLNYPRKPVANSIGEAEAIDLRDLMTWEQAPTNPRRLQEAGLRVALTSSKTRERGQFLANLRTAVRHGLKEDAALAMVTSVPAEMLGVGGQLGSIEQGKRASVVVMDGPMFASKSKIKEVWIDGKRHEVSPRPAELMGTWSVTVEPAPADGGVLSMEVGKDNAITMKKKVGEEKAKTARARNVRSGDGRLSFTFEHKPFGAEGVVTVSGAVVGEEVSGLGTRPDGSGFTFRAVRTSRDEPKASEPEAKKPGEGGEGGEGAEGGAGAAGAAGGSVVGEWAVKFAGAMIPGGELDATLTVSRSGDEYSVGVRSPMGNVEATEVRYDAGSGALEFVVPTPDGQGAAKVVSTVRDGSLSGTAAFMGQNVAVSGTKAGGGAKRGEDEDKPVTDVPAELPGYPFGAYAMKAVPAKEHVVLRGGTVWTSAKDGRIENGEVEIKDGKIVYVGKAREALPTGARMVDVKGKHVTPGIIDCHSHTGISGGVNEAGQAVTSEVRIQDVTNPDAISWYRQLAGGVTMVSNLHGSANPIGGQQAVNKPRWGAAHPEDYHYAGRGTYSDANPFEKGPSGEFGTLEKPVGLKPQASGVMPGIKFALGENVKQSNWGDRNTWRYPQTRMGVEAILRDRFNAGKEYIAAWAAWNQGGRKGASPRRDLELEAVAEILTGRRLIHCHSYRQDEILMLARLAREYGFKLGTYQHILEGYKVADAVRDSSIGASAFSDWWNFKVEVQDAIPAGGAVMHEVGVNVSFNSDSDELARRMNVEAAKARKYSRLPDGRYTVTEEEALKFVTINPAIQLGLGDRTGSLEAGKDADVVVWSGSPLSTYSKAEQTWVDGACFFSLEQDAALRKQNAAERARLMQKLLKDGPGGGGAAPRGEREGREGTDSPPARRRPPQDEERAGGAGGGRLLGRMLGDSVEAQRVIYMDLVRRGARPEEARRGVCGCDEW
jgi:imidazolonepropionase-like amidohydrolase